MPTVAYRRGVPHGRKVADTFLCRSRLFILKPTGPRRPFYALVENCTGEADCPENGNCPSVWLLAKTQSPTPRYDDCDLHFTTCEACSGAVRCVQTSAPIAAVPMGTGKSMASLFRRSGLLVQALADISSLVRHLQQVCA